MTIHQAYQQLLFQLYEIYDNREAQNIADWVMEYITEWKRIDRIINKEFPLSIQKEEQLKKITAELLNHRPVQYVLGEAWFAGMKFYVNEKVLIPRPETEELVEWIVKEVTNSGLQAVKIIDIGTGSGCIPIALKKKLPDAQITAIDVCSEALSIAVENAVNNETEIDFKLIDFLDDPKWAELGRFSIIASNPPYIKKSEAADMKKGVLDFEPSLALFVPDNDALIFYKKIAEFAQAHLEKNGTAFLEINEALGNDVVNLFKEHGFSNIELKKDLQGKDRIVKASFN
ncbi:MAG: peptide chain release factor N(5)-glutamine methyltransferase [Sphingobacteriales bacterium]